MILNLSHPVPPVVIITSIALIIALVGIGLGVVAYYKKKLQSPEP